MRSVIIITLSIVFTILCIQESRKIGRLALPPNYDDVVYCHDGMLLFQKIKHEGFSGIESYLKTRGLHSPYSVFLATSAYSLLGYRDSTPYYANWIVVLGYLLCIGYFLQKLPVLDWFLCTTIFLTLPFITMGVVEFRPDIAWAITCGFGTVFIVTRRKLFTSGKHATLAGLFLALSLLIKPSTFVMTLLLYSGAITSRIIAVVFENNIKYSLCNAWRGVLLFVGTLIILAGPYWIYFGHDAYSYFMENSFGINKSVWIFQGGKISSLLFYISGEGWDSNVGISGTILLMLVILSLIVLMIKRVELRWKLISLIAAIAGAWFVNTFAEMKSPFLGGGIYGVSIFTAAYILSEIYCTPIFLKSTIAGDYKFKTVILAILSAGTLLFYHWPGYSRWDTENVRCKTLRTANDFMLSVLQRHADHLPESILFMQAGPIIMENAGLCLASHNFNTIISSGAFFRKEEGFKKYYVKSDWVVIQEPKTEGTFDNMPSENNLSKFLEIINSDPLFHIIAEYSSPSGKKIWIYSQK